MRNKLIPYGFLLLGVLSALAYAYAQAHGGMFLLHFGHP
jgi:hypothetical protein